MGVSKSIYLILVVVVARARVPSHIVLGFRAQLDHTLRHSGTREGTSAESTCIIGLCSDERIHISCVIVGISGTESRSQHE